MPTRSDRLNGVLILLEDGRYDSEELSVRSESCSSVSFLLPFLSCCFWPRPDEGGLGIFGAEEQQKPATLSRKFIKVFSDDITMR